MDVPGLRSDWSRLTLHPDGAVYGNVPGGTAGGYSGQLQTAPVLWLIPDSFLISLPEAEISPSKEETLDMFQIR